MESAQSILMIQPSWFQIRGSNWSWCNLKELTCAVKNILLMNGASNEVRNQFDEAFVVSRFSGLIRPNRLDKMKEKVATKTFRYVRVSYPSIFESKLVEAFNPSYKYLRRFELDVDVFVESVFAPKAWAEDVLKAAKVGAVAGFRDDRFLDHAYGVMPGGEVIRIDGPYNPPPVTHIRSFDF